MLLDTMGTSMPPNTDQCIMIFDTRGAGSSNFDVSVAKGLSKISAVYTERMKAIYVVEAGWMLKGTFKLINPFLPARTQKKIKFLDLKALTQEL
jgi:hypothetical protein